MSPSILSLLQEIKSVMYPSLMYERKEKTNVKIEQEIQNELSARIRDFRLLWTIRKRS